MADQKEELVNGIESIEFATITNGVVNNDWIRMHNIADGSVSITSNADTRTQIIPEDKDAPIIVLYTPGELDIINFGGYEISPENLARFFNIIYDPATSKVTVLAKKKIANLAIRLTSRAQYNVKKQFVYRNTNCLPTFTGNITKTGLLVLTIAASIAAWNTEDGKEALWTVQKLNEDGTPINSTPAPGTFDTAIILATQASGEAESVTVTVPAPDAQLKFEFNKVLGASGLPNNMVLKISNAEVASVDFPADYLGDSFKFTDTAGAAHTGAFADGDVTLT